VHDGSVRPNEALIGVAQVRVASIWSTPRPDSARMRPNASRMRSNDRPDEPHELALAKPAGGLGVGPVVDPFADRVHPLDRAVASGSRAKLAREIDLPASVDARLANFAWLSSVAMTGGRARSIQ